MRRLGYELCETCGLERFLQDEAYPYPALIRAALAHAQFETIHPFLDGNGRMGRLLIAFVLRHEGLLRNPLLYLSLFFKQHRSEYYRLLDVVRADGDWEAWLDFFLEGVAQTAQNAVDTARRLAVLFHQDEQKVESAGRRAGSVLRVYQALCRHPLLTLNEAARQTGLTFPAVGKGMEVLSRLGIAREITDKPRNRIFAYHRYLHMLSESTEAL